MSWCVVPILLEACSQVLSKKKIHSTDSGVCAYVSKNLVNDAQPFSVDSSSELSRAFRGSTCLIAAVALEFSWAVEWRFIFTGRNLQTKCLRWNHPMH